MPGLLCTNSAFSPGLGCGSGLVSTSTQTSNAARQMPSLQDGEQRGPEKERLTQHLLPGHWQRERTSELSPSKDTLTRITQRKTHRVFQFHPWKAAQRQEQVWGAVCPACGVGQGLQQCRGPRAEP